jgi:hypothetical protein
VKVPEGGNGPLHFLLSFLWSLSRFIHTGNWAPDHKATVSNPAKLYRSSIWTGCNDEFPSLVAII